MEPGREDREHKYRYTLTVTGNSHASMEPGREDREHKERDGAVTSNALASMEPGREDRAHRHPRSHTRPSAVPRLNGTRP